MNQKFPYDEFLFLSHHIFNVCDKTNDYYFYNQYLLSIENLTDEKINKNIIKYDKKYKNEDKYINPCFLSLCIYFLYEKLNYKKIFKYIVISQDIIIISYLKSWVLFHDIIDYYISEFKKIYIITNTKIYYDMLNNFYYLNDPLNLNSIDIKKYGIDNLDKEKNYLHKLIDDFIKPKDEDEIFNPDIAYLRNKNISYEEKYTYDNFLSLLCYIEEDLRGLIEDEKYIE